MENRKNDLQLALNFLIDSIDSSKGGSRAYYSRFYNPISGWSLMYPETTGYLIPTFFEYGKIFKDDKVVSYAIRMADWLLSIQNDDGSFPGLLYKKKNRNKSIFNSSQILIGLVAAYNLTNEERYLVSCTKCSNWIVKNQENDGAWIQFNYQKDFTPSYYTRVAWPLLMVWKLNDDPKLKSAAVKTLKMIYERKMENGFIKYSGFEKKFICVYTYYCLCN
jgi:uncharacterized protein YyaL (SSP411 family)